MNGRGTLAAAYRLHLAQRGLCRDMELKFGGWCKEDRAEVYTTFLYQVLEVIRFKMNVVLSNIVTGKADLDNAEPFCVG